MKDCYPDAVLGYFIDGRMYWKVKMNPVFSGVETAWTILALYKTDYTLGSSVEVYPLKPSYKDLLQKVKHRDATRTHIPHTYLGSLGVPCLSVCFIGMTHQDRKSFTTVATDLKATERWIMWFELYLRGKMEYDI